MSPTKPISISKTRINGVEYALTFIKDLLGKKAAIFTCDEPGKGIDETTFTEDQLKALNALMPHKKQ